MSISTRTEGAGLDAALLAVIANRFDSVCREMTNTLLRSGRSAVLNMARDFSCSLVTGDNQLLASAEGLPVHVFGSQFLSEAMCNLHPDLVEGDAFLHNDVYLGNTHSADHTILVPVFVDGEHLFTCCAKAHQADCGNSLPTTYAPFAGDVYEEGALNFPCVKVQRDFKDIDDIIRMCRRRIRVPDQWYGDYLAMLGAARIGERRLKELAAKFGKALIRDFIREWFDYSERRMIHALQQLPSAELTGTGLHDPFPAVPEGVPLKVQVKIDAVEGRVEIDLRDNIDCVPCGLNESKTCAINNTVTGLFNSIDPGVPHNAGSFRRITVLLRENCVVGIPRFPTSCSVATTNIGDRLVNITQGIAVVVGFNVIALALTNPLAKVEGFAKVLHTQAGIRLVEVDNAQADIGFSETGVELQGALQVENGFPIPFLSQGLARFRERLQRLQGWRGYVFHRHIIFLYGGERFSQLAADLRYGFAQFGQDLLFAVNGKLFNRNFVAGVAVHGL